MCPAKLAPYERRLRRRPSMRAQIWSSDIMPTFLRGIEFYRDRPIFHGLGNGCVVTRALSPDQTHPSPRRVGPTGAASCLASSPIPPTPWPRSIRRPCTGCWRGSCSAERGSMASRLPAGSCRAARPARPRHGRAAPKRSQAYVRRISHDAGLPPLHHGWHARWSQSRLTVERGHSKAPRCFRTSC